MKRALTAPYTEDRAYALVFEDDSRFFHLTGTGHSALEYGLEVSAPATKPYPGVGLWLLGRSSDYEVDHLEIHDTGFAGLTLVQRASPRPRFGWWTKRSQAVTE